MNIKGFMIPSYSATFYVGDREQYVNKICKIMDFNAQVKNALIMNAESSELVTIDLGSDCKYFLCDMMQGFPLPLGLDYAKKLQLVGLCLDGDASITNMRISIIMTMSLQSGVVKEEYFKKAASIEVSAMSVLINFAQNNFK